MDSTSYSVSPRAAAFAYAALSPVPAAAVGAAVELVLFPSVLTAAAGAVDEFALFPSPLPAAVDAHSEFRD